MRASRLPLIAILALVVTACASTEPIPSEPYAAPAASELATVYVFRPDLAPGQAHVKIQVDGQAVAVLPAQRFTWFRVTPGRHVVRVGPPLLPNPDAALTVDLPAASTTLLRYQDGSGTADVPILGRGSRTAGSVRVDEAGWTDLQVMPAHTLDTVASQFEYVAARR